MQFNRTNFWVALGFLFLFVLATPSFGQGPLGFQLFAPADVSTYGGDIEPNEGYFFQFDGLYWAISPPKVHLIGYPGSRNVYFGISGTGSGTISTQGTQVSSLDTSFIDSQFSAGNRFEFGRVEDGQGIFMSIYQQRNQSQFIISPEATMVFNDLEQGPEGKPLLYGNVNNDGTTTPPYSPPNFQNLPVMFYGLTAVNSINTWGLELNYLRRLMTCHSGGTFELFLGARYYEFNEDFRVTTQPDDGTHTVPSFLGGSYWDTNAENHIIGPQIGLRWFKKQGRWTLSTEGRFFAGINNQTIHQQVDMGPNLNPGPITTITTNPNPPPINLIQSSFTPFQPKVMTETSATHVVHENEWSPAIELRLEGRYEITRSLSFHAGWTGFWMGGIARGSSLIDYTVPSMGINMADNRQNLFVNGLTLGFDINR
jgi:hypothetical protein